MIELIKDKGIDSLPNFLLNYEPICEFDLTVDCLSFDSSLGCK